MKKVLIDIKDAVVSDYDPSESADTPFIEIDSAQLEAVSSSDPVLTSSTSTADLGLADASSGLPPASLLEDRPTTQITADEPEDNSDMNNNIR